MPIERKSARKCKRKGCDNLIATQNKSGICSNCQGKVKNEWKEKYEKLKKFYEKKFKLYAMVMLDYYKKLKKYEPNIRWVDENE